MTLYPLPTHDTLVRIGRGGKRPTRRIGSLRMTRNPWRALRGVRA